MSELSKERLPEILKDWFENFGWAFKEDKEAYQQLKELIQNQPEVDEAFMKKWSDILFGDIVEMLKEAGVKIKE